MGWLSVKNRLFFQFVIANSEWEVGDNSRWLSSSWSSSPPSWPPLLCRTRTSSSLSPAGSAPSSSRPDSYVRNLSPAGSALSSLRLDSYVSNLSPSGSALSPWDRTPMKVTCPGLVQHCLPWDWTPRYVICPRLVQHCLLETGLLGT